MNLYVRGSARLTQSVMRKILLFADYLDHVLWDRSEDGKPIAPETLGLSEETIRLLWEWYRMWGQIEYKDRGGGDANIDWLLFDEKGISLWRRLRGELAGRYNVMFYSHRLEEDFEDPDKLEMMLRDVPTA